jgi:hypothetical protein
VKSGVFVLQMKKSYLLLVFGQLLEIIFTFFTVNVWFDEEPAPTDPEAPTPVEEEPTPPEAEVPVEGEVLAEPEALGLEPLEELMLEAAEEPVKRTWWPTWSVSLEVSPAS